MRTMKLKFKIIHGIQEFPENMFPRVISGSHEYYEGYLVRCDAVYPRS
jgi:hypothetical protein